MSGQSLDFREPRVGMGVGRLEQVALLRSHIEIHGIRIHSGGAHEQVSQTCKHQVGTGHCHDELTGAHERGLLRSAIPEDDRICAEIAAIDRHRKGDAV